MKKRMAAAVLFAVLLVPGMVRGTGAVCDFEGDTVGQPPAGFSVSQTGGGKVAVEHDAVFGNFARLTAAPAGTASADAHINREINVQENYLIIRAKIRANDSAGNKKLLLRDKNAKFIELAYFREGKFGFLSQFPGGGEEPAQIGAVYDLEFTVDIRGKTISVKNGETVLTAGADFSDAVFQFGKITFRCQNASSGGTSAMDADDISLALMQDIQDGLCVSPVWYEDTDGNEKAGVTPGELRVCRLVENRSGKNRSLWQLAAVKKDALLSSAAAEPVSVEAGESRVFRTEVRVPDTYLNGGELVSYLWDRETMKPVSTVSVSEKGNVYYAPAAGQVLADFAQTAGERGRPWVITDRARLDLISETADPDMSGWKKKILANADSICGQDPVAYRIVDGRLLEVSRKVLDRTQNLAVAYAASGNVKYRDRLWRELSAAAGFPDWHPAHFLDTAEMTAAFAIGYDWLYDLWSPAEREVLRRAIVEKGLTPGLKCYRGELGSYGNWVGWDWNWNVVCNGGLAAGAMAVMDTDPKLAAEIISRGLESYQVMVGEFAPDGAWKEGPSYWHYTIKYLTIYMTTLQSALGTDYGYGNAEGIGWTAYYLIYMTGVDRTFNLNDSGDGRVSAPELFWLAGRYRDPSVSRYKLDNIRRGYYSVSPMDLIWYDPAGTADENHLPLERKFRDSEVVTFRDSWTDTSLFAGLHGGANNVPHGNLDAGTFVLDMQGQRFACDLGGDSYELDGYFDNSKKRWRYYRTRAEGHNTIVLNPGSGPDQKVDSFSEITAFSEGGSSPFAIADTTPAQSGAALSAKRGMMLVQNRTGVVVRDELTLREPGEAYWFMHTQARIEGYGSDGRSVILERGGKRIWVGILDGEGTFYDTEAKPLPASPQSDAQNANAGVRKLVIHRTGISGWNLTVAFLPLENGAESPAAVPAVPELALWTTE